MVCRNKCVLSLLSHLWRLPYCRHYYSDRQDNLKHCWSEHHSLMSCPDSFCFHHLSCMFTARSVRCLILDCKKLSGIVISSVFNASIRSCVLSQSAVFIIRIRGYPEIPVSRGQLVSIFIISVSDCFADRIGLQHCCSHIRKPSCLCLPLFTHYFW